MEWLHVVIGLGVLAWIVERILSARVKPQTEPTIAPPVVVVVRPWWQSLPVLLGVGALALLALCPPWLRAGHGFILSPPSTAPYAPGVDYARLGLEAGAVVLLTGIALLLRARLTPPR